MKLNLKTNFSIFVIFVLAYIFLYISLDVYTNSRTNEILKEQEKYLEISYKQGLDRFETIAQNIYYEIQDDTKLIDLISQTNSANIDKSHHAIYEYLKDEFKNLKYSGVMGLQIVSPDGISIVRMHQKDRYGDDLTIVRPMIRELIKQRVYHSGFEEGKTSHAFREAFPLYKNGIFIGGIEILFSSTKLQDYTMRVSNIHTHFIVNKNVFKTNEWKSNIQEPYEQSIEHQEYLFSMNDHIKHNVLKVSAATLIKPLRKEIDKGFARGDNFNVFRVVDTNAKVLNFYAVQRFVDNKTVAYLVSYTNVQKLYDFIQLMNKIKVGVFIILLLLYIMVIRLLSEKQTVLHELKYDHLTQIYTRKYFIESAQKEAEKILVKNKVFCIVMADIDFFKNINDTYGHQCGDRVLQEFAKILKESLRSVDMVARYGGEEFVILLHTDIENGYMIVEQIRKKIENFSFGKVDIKLTGSFGIFECRDQESVDIISLIARADSALYKAKNSGRNQVQII